MPTVVVNGVAMEARIGERLLDVARRNGAHIGFVCDGSGICQTCQCRVLEGAQLLNPPTEAEKIWMPERRLRDGNRLACQAALRGNGQVAVLTSAEELRSLIFAVINPPPGTSSGSHLAALITTANELNIDQLALFPGNVINTIRRLGLARFLWPFKDVSRYLSDSTRAIEVAARTTPPLPTIAPPAASAYEARLDRATAALRAAREQAPPTP